MQINYDYTVLLQDVSTVIEGNAATAAPSDSGAPPADAAGAFGGMNTIGMILIWVAVIAIFYFVSIRPQSKRDKKMKEMQAGIKAGDNILTTSGFYGTVMDVGEDCFVVEFGTNRGVRIPVRKSDVVGIKAPNLHPNAAAPAGK